MSNQNETFDADIIAFLPQSSPPRTAHSSSIAVTTLLNPLLRTPPPPPQRKPLNTKRSAELMSPKDTTIKKEERKPKLNRNLQNRIVSNEVLFSPVVDGTSETFETQTEDAQ